MKIRIVSTPPGEAPLHVRDAWVGLVFPVARGQGPVETMTQGVLSGSRTWWGVLMGLILGRCKRERGYPVVAADAVEILSGKDGEAAAWWREHTPHLLVKGRCFLFHEVACEVVADGE